MVRTLMPFVARWLPTLQSPWSSSYAPPIVSIVAAFDHFAACSFDVLLKLAVLIQVVVSIVCDGFFLWVFVLVRPEYPWDQLILIVTLIPTPSTILLLESPDEEECLPCTFLGHLGSEGLQDTANSFDPAIWCREVVYHSYRDGEVESAWWVGERENVCDNRRMWFMLGSEFDELG